MAVVKRTLSLDPEVMRQLEELAREEQTGVSTLANAMLGRQLLRERGLRAMRDFEREHGAFTAAELHEADRLLDQADDELGSASGPRGDAQRAGRTAG